MSMEITMKVLLKRSSVRTYSGEVPSDAEMDILRNALAAASADILFGSCPRFTLVAGAAFGNSDRALKIGTYGVIRNAPLFLVGAVRPGPGALIGYGYAMEGVLLTAASLGLGSCWLAGTFSRASAAQSLGLEEGEMIPAVSPLGRSAERRSLVEAAMRAGAGSSRRKAWLELFWDGGPGRPLTEVSAGPWAPALEAVRWGPSASNKQPWRINRTGEGDFELLHAEDRVYNRALGYPIQDVDMGIALRRFECAAGILGLKGSWVPETTDGVIQPPVSLRRIASWRSGT